MKQLSYWAKFHPKTARLIIILLYIPINIIGFTLGSLLWKVGIQFETLFIQLIISFVAALYFLYPEKASFYKRKLFHGLMAVCTFLMICFYGNQVYNPTPDILFIKPIQAVSYTNVEEQPAKSEISKSKKEARQQKKEYKKQLRKTTNGKNLPVWAKILLITLTVAVAVGLLILLAYLSCSISCSGAEALAVLVALAGTFGIVFGTIRLIQVILGKERKKKRTKSSTD